jgi:APA family basic amino acid/polyamine antiporter
MPNLALQKLYLLNKTNKNRAYYVFAHNRTHMPKLEKKLTLYGLTMIAIGGCIGSGIFATPNGVIQQVPHHGLALLVWAIGGLIALTGALTFAELGGMFPRAGGVYVYIKEAYGKLAGFLYGWVILLVINTGALAALSVVFADYMQFFIPDMTETRKTVLAIFTIAGLTGINMIGVNISQFFTNLFSGLKLAAIAGIIIAGIVFYEPANVNLELFDTSNAALPDNLMGAMLVGLIGVLWSFGGWHHASYLAGETKNAEKTVPRAMILGVTIVTIVYLLANIAYMLLMPLPEIAASGAVAGDALQSVTPIGGKIAAVIIAISIFGTIGIYTMSAPRIYFAMAKDGVFFPALAKINNKFRTPINAMAIQAIWAIFLLLIFRSDFHNLITFVTFMDIVFMTLGGICVFIFRVKLHNAVRPYHVFLYPIVPAIFVGVSGAFVINTMIEKTWQAGVGIVILSVGVLAFFLFKRINDKNNI